MSLKFQQFFRTLLILFVLTQASVAQDPSSWGQTSSEYLIKGATIIVSPGRTIEDGELYIKDGVITNVGTRVAVPAGTREIDLKGSTIHAGFIDPYVVGGRVGLKKKDKDRPTPVSGSHPRAHDDFRVSDSLDLKAEALDKFRKAGFTLLAIAPEGGIFRGQAALYRTGSSENDAELLVEPSIYSTLGFEELGWSKLKGQNYPLSKMGVVAFIRQNFLDTVWYEKHRQDETLQGPRPKYDGNLESLIAVNNGSRPMFWETKDYLETLRMMKLAGEIGSFSPIVMLSGQEWKELSWLKAYRTGKEAFVLPLKFPDEPKAGPGISEAQITLDVLKSWYYAPANPRWLHEAGFRFAFTSHHNKDLKAFRKRVFEAVTAGLSSEAALAALTTEPAKLLGMSSRYGTLDKGKSASFVVRNAAPFAAESTISEVWVDGERFQDYEAIGKGEVSNSSKVKARKFVSASNYVSKPVGLPAPTGSGSVVVKNATLWTQDGAGVLQEADLLVRDGTIQAVGPNLASASGAMVVDGRGLHVTPGIVDAHSHTAIDGMVNEPGANITAMVRMKDVIDPFDYDLYLQLASGVTTVNILHGSANAIGGQAVTCKWRYGSAPHDLVMAGAPEGIKFALGENPKQSNWGDQHSTRYPQSRMGVSELVRGAFISTHNYRKLKAEGADPKPDLVLDALSEVLDDKRIVHCHSYRQDEILALLQVAEEVGFKVHVLQHVLEGYKVAKEIAAHGASASTFADWWAYKVEVQDAIPHNASLMAEAGVLVSVNSDSADLARRLNTEAAKSIRYGGMSEVEALNLITRNPAQQLRILNRTGTLTAGKDGDFVIWSDHPLTQKAKVLETWIEGKRYFQASGEAQRVKAHDLERNRLYQLTKMAKEK